MTAHNKTLPLLPYLCSPAAILALIVVGELLALVITLADTSTALFSWSRFGAVSMMIQWILLCSALIICQCRHWLNQRSPVISGLLTYGLCLLITALVLWLSQAITPNGFDWILWSKGLLIGAIYAGIMLRYLYVQQQLINRQQTENQARIEALQARIRPHFLFNSMNTIASLISVDPEKAEQTVEDLSELFRASLKQPGMIPLKDELEICRRYIAIEQLRLGERLQVDWQMPAPLPSTIIPSLLLQPLLENAISHGIQRLVEGGIISVIIKTEPQQLIISISNPLPDTSTDNHKQGNRIALDNIQHRLEMHYGKQAQFAIKHSQHNYTVTITLPWTC